MKMSIEFDEKHQRPRAILEGESVEEDDKLRQLLAFGTVTFGICVSDDEEEVEVPA